MSGSRVVKFIGIDLEQVRSMDDFHDLVARELSFPGYYGRNLDAFWDCLTEIFGKTRIQITGGSSMEPALRREIARYIGVLKEYEKATNGEFQVTAP